MNDERNPAQQIGSKIKGFYVYDHVELEGLKILVRDFEDRVHRLGYLNMEFPTVGHRPDLEKQVEHFAINGEVLNIEHKNWYLKPTSESVAYPLIYGNEAVRYPFRWYQKSVVFRNQTNQCKKFFRSKQIRHFMELHAIFVNEASQLQEIKKLYVLLCNWFKKLGIPVVVRMRPPEDTFPGANHTFAFDVQHNGDSYQIATLHDLGNRFSKTYNRSKNNDSYYGVCLGWSERLYGVYKLLYGSDFKYVLNPYACVNLDRTSSKFKKVYVEQYKDKKKTLARALETYKPVIYSLNHKCVDRITRDTYESEDHGLRSLKHRRNDVIKAMLRTNVCIKKLTQKGRLMDKKTFMKWIDDRTTSTKSLYNNT